MSLGRLLLILVVIVLGYSLLQAICTELNTRWHRRRARKKESRK